MRELICSRLLRDPALQAELTGSWGDWLLQSFQVLHLLSTPAENRLLVRLYVRMRRVWSICVSAHVCVCAHFSLPFPAPPCVTTCICGLPVSVCSSACVTNIVFLKHEANLLNVIIGSPGCLFLCFSSSSSPAGKKKKCDRQSSLVCRVN